MNIDDIEKGWIHDQYQAQILREVTPAQRWEAVVHLRDAQSKAAIRGAIFLAFLSLLLANCTGREELL